MLVGAASGFVSMHRGNKKGAGESLLHRGKAKTRRQRCEDCDGRAARGEGPKSIAGASGKLSCSGTVSGGELNRPRIYAQSETGAASRIFLQPRCAGSQTAP